MHDDLESFSQNPSQKICRNLFDFEKPQIFQQIPKSRSECMKCMIKGLKRDHTCEICNDKTKEWVGKMKRLSEKSLGVREKSVYQKRSKRNETKIVKHVYIEVS